MKKRITALFVVFTMMLCLAGCVKNTGLEINIFNSTKVFYSYSMPDSFINQTYGSVDDFYKTASSDMPDGYSFEQFEDPQKDGSMEYGYEIKSPVLPQNELQESLKKAIGEDVDVTYSCTGFFIKNIHVHLTSDGEGMPEYEKYGMNEKFTVIVPSFVTSTDGEISAQKNKVEWNITELTFGTKKEFDINVSYLNLVPILICCAVLLIVVVTIIIVIKSKKKKSNEQTGSDPVPSGEINPAVGEVQENTTVETQEMQEKTDATN